MKLTRLITATAFATAGLVAAQSAMAYQAGDLYVRGGIAKSEVSDDNGRLAGQPLDVSDERGFSYGLGYQFHDKLGVELNGTQDMEHDLTLGGVDTGSVDRRPVNLMVNYYPLGGSASRVQPYVGAGVNYTYFNDESAPGLDIDASWGAAGQVGVDLALTDHLLVGAYANYADVDADVALNGNDLGEAEIDPVTVGGGVTYRF
ncbi:OmpW/AlkL family protein [Halomonas koreensis]|uniref:OmpW family outer membrane protein n=1 Tax=Halomonas koreensis TaxID=245385 RepID=A0ABU1G452_9GAMM|nr:OmpW family outer membrane protein [Halomonas koreensis]MDR5867727.1 OmpW family outer membrane protein [Halomonas koreensis]